ncbi:S1 family peptidase [Methylomonas sp. 2BW1-5-20]|uniref:S1 family peptidase n=1 Tax=Methylomonas sp. 2BW1-5-20 TaxID=3376686 RepID=UPI0040524112
MQCDWQLDNPHFFQFGSGVSRTIVRLARECLPEFLEMFPMQYGWEMRCYCSDSWFAAKITSNRGSSIPSINEFSQTEMTTIRELLPFRPRRHNELSEILGSDWFNNDVFTYIGPFQASKACYQDVCQHLMDWLNTYVVPDIEKWNRLRVMRAIPEAPQFNIELIRKHLWVLECEDSLSQGTAFSLEGVGLVTCEHVLGPKTHAFRPSDYNTKFPVRIVAANRDIDLAVISIDPLPVDGLSKGTSDNLSEMDHLAVTGFPNYRIGDSGVISPGLVIGFRISSGIRRILTNAPIVAGASGAPVLDKGNNVVGIAVTGSDSIATAHNTEKHGIIPIDAIKFLGLAG